jgi:hypothetical protein
MRREQRDRATLRRQGSEGAGTHAPRHNGSGRHLGRIERCGGDPASLISPYGRGGGAYPARAATQEVALRCLQKTGCREGVVGDGCFRSEEPPRTGKLGRGDGRAPDAHRTRGAREAWVARETQRGSLMVAVRVLSPTLTRVALRGQLTATTGSSRVVAAGGWGVLLDVSGKARQRLPRSLARHASLVPGKARRAQGNGAVRRSCNCGISRQAFCTTCNAGKQYVIFALTVLRAD